MSVSCDFGDSASLSQGHTERLELDGHEVEVTGSLLDLLVPCCRTAADVHAPGSLAAGTLDRRSDTGVISLHQRLSGLGPRQPVPTPSRYLPATTSTHPTRSFGSCCSRSSTESRRGSTSSVIWVSQRLTYSSGVVSLRSSTFGSTTGSASTRLPTSCLALISAMGENTRTIWRCLRS